MSNQPNCTVVRTCLALPTFSQTLALALLVFENSQYNCTPLTVGDLLL